MSETTSTTTPTTTTTMAKLKLAAASAVAGAALVLVLAAVAGCESDADRAARGEGFPPEGTVRSPQRFVDVQQAAGARGEGNLYEAHFVGAELNSLGRAKLDAMLRDDDALPVVVHLTPVDDANLREHRMQAIAIYLQDGGLSASQIRFTDGLNEDAVAPAAPGLKNLKKTDSAAQAEPDAMELAVPLPGTVDTND